MKNRIILFIASAIKWSLIVFSYIMVCQVTASYFLDLYKTSMTVKISFPSEGMLVISVFLFWLVVFMVPSYQPKPVHSWQN